MSTSTPAIRPYGLGTYGSGKYGAHANTSVITAPAISIVKLDSTGLVRNDLSCDMRGISIRSGRSAALGAFGASTCTLQLANFSDKYSAWTPNSIWSAGSGGDGVTLGEYRTSQPISVRVTRQGITYPLFTGTTDSVEDTWPGIYDAIAVVQCTDDFKLFARHINTVEAVPPVGAGELTGARVLRFLSLAGYDAAGANIAAGTQALQATDTKGTTLNLLDEVRECEFGYLFMNGAGKLQFLARNAGATVGRMREPQWTLSDKAGVGGAYSDAHLVADDDLVYNTATITATNGQPQTTTFQPSVDWFGPRSYPGSGTLPLVTDVQASNLADLVVSQFQDNDRRIESVTFHANAQNPYLLDMACGVQLLDRIRFVRTFPGGHQLDVQLLVQGINHDIRANVDGNGIGDWTVTLSTTNVVDYITAAAWDDAVWDESPWGE